MSSHENRGMLHNNSEGLAVATPCGLEYSLPLKGRCSHAGVPSLMQAVQRARPATAADASSQIQPALVTPDDDKMPGAQLLRVDM